MSAHILMLLIDKHETEETAEECCDESGGVNIILENVIMTALKILNRIKSYTKQSLV